MYSSTLRSTAVRAITTVRSAVRTIAAVAVTLALMLGLVRPAGAQDLPIPTTDAAAQWLAGQFGATDLLDGWTPGVSDIGTTLQAILGFAMTGTQTAQADAAWAAVLADVETAIAPYGDDDPGRLGLMIMVAAARGEDPASIAGVDLVARLLATQQASGLFGAGDPTYDGAFRQGLALLGLSAAGVTNAAGTDWLVAQQCADGGWTSYRVDTTVACPAVDLASFVGADTNSTALAAMALSAQGVTIPVDPIAWFEAARTAEGGWAYFGSPDQTFDGNSTAIVLAAINTLVGFLDPNGAAALMTLQGPCSGAVSELGGFAYQLDTDGTVYADNVATAQSLWALSGLAMPAVDVPASAEAAIECANAPTTTTSGPTTTTDGTMVTIEAVTTTAPAESATTTSTTIAGSTTATSSTSTSTTTTTTTSTTAPTTTTTAAAQVLGASQSAAPLARTGSNENGPALLGLVLASSGVALLAAARVIARRREG